MEKDAAATAAAVSRADCRGDIGRGGSQVAGAHDAGLGHAEAQDQVVPPQCHVAVAAPRRAGLLGVHRVAGRVRAGRGDVTRAESGRGYCVKPCTFTVQEALVQRETEISVVKRQGGVRASCSRKPSARKDPFVWKSNTLGNKLPCQQWVESERE